MGIAAGIVAGYNLNRIVVEYLAGCKTVLYAGTVLDAARAITIVLEDGVIIDSIF